MRHVLLYLPPEEAAAALRSGQPITEHCPNGKLTCAAMDVVYFITVVRGARELFLIGRMEVGRVKQISQYRQRLFASQCGTSPKAVNVTRVAPLLRFETRSNLDHLLLSEDGTVNPLQFCAPRVLAGSTWISLEMQWATTTVHDAKNRGLALAIELEAQGDSAEEIFEELFEEKIESRHFFPDREKIQQVEERAVEIVTDYYESEGFEVVSMEHDYVGFDLECVKRTPRRPPLIEHVEVKGVSGSKFEFVVTAREVTRAKHDPFFVLWVVTHALSDYKPYKFSGAEFLEFFDLQSTEFRATSKGNWTAVDRA
jgi:hypothetical protein